MQLACPLPSRAVASQPGHPRQVPDPSDHLRWHAQATGGEPRRTGDRTCAKAAGEEHGALVHGGGLHLPQSRSPRQRAWIN